MTKPLIIFDCDGVLVDSEIISCGLLKELLEEEGIQVSDAYVYDQFLGRSLTTIKNTIQEGLGCVVPIERWSQFDSDVLQRFSRDLKPVPNIATAILGLSSPFCVASSSNPARIMHSLRKASLSVHFGANIFSSVMVKRGKPFPDLFLHSAQSMGYKPEKCIVVEDSPAGVFAAKAAGIQCIGYTGASHSKAARLNDKLSEAKADLIIHDMACLSAAIETLSAQSHRDATRIQPSLIG